MKKLILLLTLFVFNFTISFADTPHFIDFNKVLNKSKAGAAAQTRDRGESCKAVGGPPRLRAAARDRAPGQRRGGRPPGRAAAHEHAAARLAAAEDC